MKKGNVTRSTGFQIVLYFVLAAGFFAACFSALTVGWLWENGAYAGGFEKYLHQMLHREVDKHVDYIMYEEAQFPTLNDMIEACRYESAYNNIVFSIRDFEGDEELWSNVPDPAGPLAEFTYICSREVGNAFSAAETEERKYCVKAYVNLNFPKTDELKQRYETAMPAYDRRNLFAAGAIGGALLFAISAVWLMCNAGHRWGREGIIPGVLTNIYLDVLSAFFGAAALFLLYVIVSLSDGGSFFRIALLISVGGTLEAVWCTIYLRELALRMKLGKWWRHSLIFVVCRSGIRLVRGLWRMTVKLLTGLPAILAVAVAVLFLTFCEFVGILWWGETELFVCWLFEKLIEVPVVLYCALAFSRLQRGSRALADGDLSRKVGTDYLFFQFREQGENLNRINEGISKAVEQRLQSERLKTELITNVSHDLKTPLTSIINYADLLGNAALGARKAGNETERRERIGQIQEYSEVLLRQSARLKKLLDDLVDASKATTGNLEVNPVPCELGVLLTQMAGEYEAKLAEKELALHIVKPEEEIRILADGRHLWRVFDNLMNNICKYAQEGSRVYLNMERRDRQVEIIFRNMSKYELNISPQELSERFVRGDASRHMEGSGLGLSIAKSLVELQKGEMEILTDGDLFKVILRFEVLE